MTTFEIGEHLVTLARELFSGDNAPLDAEVQPDWVSHVTKVFVQFRRGWFECSVPDGVQADARSFIALKLGEMKSFLERQP